LNYKGVSIIICCFNSSLLLEETLKHIAVQKLDNAACEIVLVDNASTDHTQEIARSIWEKSGSDKISFKIVYEPKPGLTFARQKGVNEARFEYLIFCDDDNWLDENYVQNTIELFKEHTDTGILGGNGSAIFEDEALKPLWFSTFLDMYAAVPQAKKETALDFVYGAGMAVRKTVLKEVMGKYPMLLKGREKAILSSGEDSEICLRARLAGHKILYSPKLTFKHFIINKRLTWSYLKKLDTGLAKTFVIINLYETALNSKRLSLPLFYWLKKMLYYWGIYFKYWPKHYLIYRKTEGTIAELHHITWKNIALDYLKYNFKTVSIYNKIIAFKK